MNHPPFRYDAPRYSAPRHPPPPPPPPPPSQFYGPSPFDEVLRLTHVGEAFLAEAVRRLYYCGRTPVISEIFPIVRLWRREPQNGAILLKFSWFLVGNSHFACACLEHAHGFAPREVAFVLMTIIYRVSPPFAEVSLGARRGAGIPFFERLMSPHESEQLVGLPFRTLCYALNTLPDLFPSENEPDMHVTLRCGVETEAQIHIYQRFSFICAPSLAAPDVMVSSVAKVRRACATPIRATDHPFDDDDFESQQSEYDDEKEEEEEPPPKKKRSTVLLVIRMLRNNRFGAKKANINVPKPLRIKS